jgi:hypothetical protein
LAEGDIARDVLEREPASENVLNLADTVNDVVQRFLGVRDGQEVVQVDPVHAGPAEMVGDPFRIDARGEFFQRAEIIHVERRGGGNRERDAVHHHGITLDDLVEQAQGLAALDHVVFRDNLEPIDGGVAIENLFVMLRSQPQAKAEIRRLFGRHGFSS